MRRATARRPLIATLLAIALLALAGCGGAKNDGSATVAKAVAAPALPQTTSTERPTDGGAPASHAVEPEVGQSSPATNTTDEQQATGTDPPPASTSASAPRRNASAGTGILSAADRASFARLASSLGGQSGLAASGLGVGRRVERVGTLQSAIAWSTAKVPVAMAVIASRAGATQQANLRSAITASDNAAALRLWSSLGGGQDAADASDEQLRQAGDTRTQIESRALRGSGYTPFGQTAWALPDQARFTAGLACTQAGAQVLGLMNQVVPGQRWGLGSAGVQAQFKGGWGPGHNPGRAAATSTARWAS